MKDFFVVLGGMGTLATEHFIHQLNAQTPIQIEQDYLNYTVVNHASIPDRTAFLLDPTAENPIAVLQEDIRQYSQLQPDFFVLTCNTAHTFFDQLQATTPIPILHMPRLAVKALKKRQTPKQNVMILATEGTIAQGLYERELAAAGFQPLTPNKAVQQKITTLIYTYVKLKKQLNEALFHEIITDIWAQEPECTLVLGCTELSYLYDHLETKPARILDAQMAVIEAVLQRYHKTY